MAPTAGNRELLALYDAVSRDLGLGPVTAADPLKAGAADVSFVAGLVPMALDGIGLSGQDDHTDKETADLSMLPAQTKRAAILIYRRGRRLPRHPGGGVGGAAAAAASPPSRSVGSNSGRPAPGRPARTPVSRRAGRSAPDRTARSSGAGTASSRAGAGPQRPA